MNRLRQAPVSNHVEFEPGGNGSSDLHQEGVHSPISGASTLK